MSAIPNPDAWMPREQWDALVCGDGCPLCATIAAGTPSDEYGHTVGDLDITRLRLSTNQYIPGYSILICHRHAREPYDLSPSDQRLFFADLMTVGRALDEVFQPVKMNFEILGNAVPHLHCHIKPRYYGDAAPGQPLNLLETVFLTTEEYADRIRRIRAALS